MDTVYLARGGRRKENGTKRVHNILVGFGNILRFPSGKL